MNQTLVVNHGEFEFTEFNRAISELQEEYGYEGWVWEMVVASDDLEILCYFLNDDGLDAELIEN